MEEEKRKLHIIKFNNEESLCDWVNTKGNIEIEQIIHKLTKIVMYFKFKKEVEISELFNNVIVKEKQRKKYAKPENVKDNYKHTRQKRRSNLSKLETEVIRLRKIPMTYSDISKKTGLSITGVQYYCARKGLGGRLKAIQYQPIK